VTLLDQRPRVGKMIVPFMVDERRVPIDFATTDARRVTACAERGLCGVCGGKIRRGPIAFLGPDDGRTCFADPWMHEECAEVAVAQCPFVSGRRDWRKPSTDPVEAEATAIYSRNMVLVLADNWRSHREGGVWHFEALRVRRG